MNDEAHPHSLYEAEHANRRIARIGMVMFIIYLIPYAAFVAICAFSLETMKTPILGVNLAIVYGFALIGFAFFLALIYMALCRTRGEVGDGR